MGAAKSVIDDSAAKAVKDAFTGLKEDVDLLLFQKPGGCPTCAAQRQLLEELAALSDKLHLKLVDVDNERELAQRYGIDKVPATVLVSGDDRGIRFYGVTAGAEFGTLIDDVIMFSTGRSGLEQGMEQLVAALDKEVHLQVLVSLTCPYCPRMVRAAHQFAYVNPGIRADMVELAEFPDIAKKYSAMGVPRTVINEVVFLDGLQPVGRFFMEVLKAVDPEAHAQLEQALRSLEGRRKAHPAQAEHEYEVAIIGGGPAGMSAALYAARKGLDVLLISKVLGGQVNFTARVDNYLGVPEVAGPEMVEAFRDHAELYSVAEHLGASVTLVRRQGEVFLAELEDGTSFRARSVIFCGGKEYKRLGVPGEERLIGKGLAFCATCDAPLYSGRKVAVVGGGNSAFTSLRDLLTFVSEAHLVHRRRDFRADTVLVQEVLASGKVRVHTPCTVLEFQGKERLEGMVIRDMETEEEVRLEVDGAFLEIGMEVKAGPLTGLLRLNEAGEVPVNSDMSTEFEGLFAAGDVTDVEDKQISVAVGQGAIAALSAHRYLVDKGKTSSKVEVGHTWT